METRGRVQRYGAVTWNLYWISSVGDWPWAKPETTHSWDDLLRESMDPGGEVNVSTNRWLSAPKRRPSGRGIRPATTPRL